MMVSTRLGRFSGLLIWLVGLGAGACFPVSTALAAPRDNGYSLTVSESTSSVYYGDLSPAFEADLVVPAGEPPMPQHGITLGLNGSFAYTGDVTGSAPDYTLTMPASAAWGFPPGPYTVQARYLSIPLEQYIYSNIITFTVNRGNASLLCNIMTPPVVYETTIYPTNTKLEMNFIARNAYTGGHFEVDTQNATYTLIFEGAQTFTYATIKPQPDNYDDAFITSPPVPGSYTLRCLFNGTSLFSPTETDANVTLQSAASTPPPTSTPTAAGPQPGPGSTPTGSGTHTPAGATVTPVGTPATAGTGTATATATTTPTASGALTANATTPPSSTPSALLLGTLAAAFCFGTGGLGFVFWRRRRLPVASLAPPAVASSAASTPDASGTGETRA